MQPNQAFPWSNRGQTRIVNITSAAGIGVKGLWTNIWLPTYQSSGMLIQYVTAATNKILRLDLGFGNTDDGIDNLLVCSGATVGAQYFYVPFQIITGALNTITFQGRIANMTDGVAETVQFYFTFMERFWKPLSPGT